jgi:Fe2+ transport system protein B
MDPKLRDWLSRLLNNAINMGVGSLIWRLPTWFLLFLVVGMIALVLYFKLY